jgi:serine/threonine-protein kinase
MATGADDWTGQTVSDGRYRVKAKLGEGGMGIVYRARDGRLGADVVIKVPRRSTLEDAEFAGRFAREIRSLVRLSHPCIVKVTDAGQYQGLPFAVMQYLPGGSLENRCRGAAERGVPIDPRGVTGWLPGIASALDYIHSRGYIHRDVKAGNILFDDQGHAFLSDFGVIKALAASEAARPKTLTGAGLLLGTPDYMAPELIMARPVDGRVDQYALAVTVYEAICGRRPFVAATITAVLMLHTTAPPPPPTDHAPGLPGALSAAVLRGLSKDPADRFPSCAAFAEAVAAGLAADPRITATVPPSSAAAAPPESVKLQCPACRKTVGVSRSMYGDLKRARKSLTCPECGAPIPVQAPPTQALDAAGPEVGADGTAVTPELGPPPPPPPTRHHDAAPRRERPGACDREARR